MRHSPLLLALAAVLCSTPAALAQETPPPAPTPPPSDAPALPAPAPEPAPAPSPPPPPPPEPTPAAAPAPAAAEPPAGFSDGTAFLRSPHRQFWLLPNG